MYRISKIGVTSALCLFALLLLAGNASATELIQNGGFESGLTGWTASSNVLVLTQYPIIFPNVTAYEGTHFASLAPFSILAADLSQQHNINLAQYSTVTVSFAYYWESFVDLSSVKSDSFVISLGGQPIDTIWINGSFQTPAGGSWQIYSHTFTNLPASENFSIDFHLGNEDPRQSTVAFVDNVSIQVTNPEPASLLLLGTGLAGLAILGFRRKSK